MIKAKGRMEGRETLIIGLSKENIKRLKGDQPIHFRGESVQIAHDVVILYGEDEAALAEALGVGKQEIEQAARESGLEPGDKRDVHVVRDRNDEPGPQWLIWSNKHGAWWRPGKWGYTGVIEEAGRYTRAEAEEIVRRSNIALDDKPIVNSMMVRAPEE